MLINFVAGWALYHLYFIRPEPSTVLIGEESNKEMCFPSECLHSDCNLHHRYSNMLKPVLRNLALVLALFYYPKQKTKTGYVYVPPSFSQLYIRNLEWCSKPSSDEDLESQCAERLYTDVPRFSKLFSTRLGYDGSSFDCVSELYPFLWSALVSI